MSLRTYDEKRNFNVTSEPKGAKKKNAGKQHIFVIQRHHASRLHYDFRLEVDGVLKSWAVPKGPSMNPSDKRLAMQVEDHPYDYKDFEGVIPEGNYGAGFVYVWDKGNYELLHEDGKDFDKEANKEIREGNLKIRLKGKKVKGEFALVKMKNSDDNAWLLLKHKDDYAVKEAYDSENYTPQRVKDKGVKEKEKMKGPKKKAAPAPAKAKAKTAPAKREQFTPMMATLVDKPFSRDGWLFETKWDGYRAIADVRKGQVELYSRNHLSFNKDYQKIVKALEDLPHDAVLDGEVVILKKDGASDFQSLQNYKNDASGNLVYVVFDLLQLDGQDLQALPLIQRKELLKDVVAQLGSKTVIYSEHVLNDSEKLYKTAQQKGWEGIIAKEAESLYAEGRRSMSWLKIKIVDEQETIICGYTDPQGSRKKIGSLVLGVYDENSELKYVGNCGGGLNGTLINELYDKMQPLRQKTSPFKEKVKTNTPVTWIKPELVCQVKFHAWTSDKHLRMPIFLGLRKDKPAAEVHKETAKSTKMATKKAAAQAAPAPARTHEKERVVTLSGKKVTLTNQQKIFWPDEKITKGTLLDYYIEMADYVLPFLKDRPLSLHRFPNGINDPGFYQKDIDKAAAPDWLKTVQLHAASASRDVDYLVCNNAATLAYMVNLGCIEINPWLSRVKNLDNPDYLVLDLDPENIAFKYVVETALAIKALLDQFGLTAFCKTSGASGLHIYVPTGAKYNYETCRLFAEYVAKHVQQELPRITSVIRNKSKRDKKVYIDYMQNSRGQTIASPYSVRPKPGATVSAPLNWDELTDDLAIADFHIGNMADRIRDVGDLWKDIDKTKNDLRKVIQQIEATAQ